MWTKHGRAWWSPRNQWVRRAAGLALFAGYLALTVATAAVLLVRRDT